MPLAKIADSRWNKLEFTCSSDISIGNSSISGFMQSVLNLNSQSPIDEIKFKNGILTIKFHDTRVWKIKLYTRDINTDVSYIVDQNAKWSRQFILGFVTPVNNSVINLFANYNLDEIDGKLI